MNIETINHRGIFISILIIALIIALFSNIVTAPPTPHSVNGYIFHTNGSQVELNTKYRVNVSNGDTLIFFKQGKTSFPIPGQSGYYSESVSGTDGDTITVTSWNASHYGLTQKILFGIMSGFNVTINITRSPEPVMNITNIQSNTLKNSSTIFTLLSNLTLYGSNSTNCKAEISFSNESVVSMYNSEPEIIDLGTLVLGYSLIYNWNLSFDEIGNTNITINFTCDSMFGTKFEELNYSQTLSNITIIDGKWPDITVISPKNNTSTPNSSIMFYYNVSDFSDVSSCSLYLNGTLAYTNETITKDATMFFNNNLVEGLTLWQIMCNDSYNNIGATSNFSITKDTKNRTVYTELVVYTQGFTARILGYNWTSNANITLIITKSDASLVARTVLANNNGLLNTTYFINYSDPVGDYNITAYETNYFFYNSTTNFSVIFRYQSLGVDKMEYLSNENVTITGHNFTNSGRVNIRIFLNATNSTGYFVNVTSNSSGYFSLKFNVTTLCTGVYGITARDLNYTIYEETVYFNVSASTPCINWGNRLPNITSVIFDDQFSSPQNEINMLAGVFTHVFCNFTGIDLEGISDMINANATIYYHLNKSSDPDNNNTHYSNSTCEKTGDNGLDTNYYSCGFNILYYANNGTWVCNATVVDEQGAKGYGNDSSRILDLIAVNMTSLIDYGDVATGIISLEIPLIITNFGNARIDVNMSAYGVTPNDGVALNCTTNNISLADEKYTLISGTDFASMTSVTSNPATLSSFNLLKQTNNTYSQKSIYYRVKPTAFSLGDCQGNIVITAVAG